MAANCIAIFASASLAQTDITAYVKGDRCIQPPSVRDPSIAEAEKQQFNVRRVEISGSTYTRDKEFRRRMVVTNEGDIFERKNLEMTVKRIAKMRSIYPITINDVVVGLDRQYKDIDIVFCVRQKPKKGF